MKVSCSTCGLDTGSQTRPRGSDFHSPTEGGGAVTPWLAKTQKKKKLPGLTQPQEKMGFRVNSLGRNRKDSVSYGVSADSDASWQFLARLMYNDAGS